MTTNLQKNTGNAIPSIKEALSLIGIKELTANIYSLPKKKTVTNTKKTVVA